MNYFIFSTGGDWDTTSLYRNGEEFPANRLYIKFETGRDEDGEPRKGGLENGGDATCYIAPQQTSTGDWALFPGKIDLEFPRHKLTIENNTPNFAIELTRVTLDNRDVSNEILDIEIDVDAIQNRVSAYLTTYKHHVFGADEVATHTLL